jgi:hypothetical protein
MPAKHRTKHRQAKRGTGWRAQWLHGRRLALLCVGVLAALLAFGEVSVLLISHHAAPTPGWIIEGDQLQDLLSYLPSNLPATYFNSRDTVVLKNFTGGSNPVPRGWHSQMGGHYTSFASHGCGSGCVSLQRDLAAGKLNTQPKPIALYDDENWARTPGAEQRNPCGAMSQFVAAAHQHGLTTIVAPDQDLAAPGVITSYQGGESENWQTYLRLGLGACAAQSESEWYHVMSQPFEAHWCGNPLGKCQSSESDFVNFVTQAALQAKADNPNVKISDGLSTSPKYFGNFRGAATLAGIMYRDYADVQRVVNSVWLNVVGRNADTTTLYFLAMINNKAHTDRRSSVFFLHADKSAQNSQPNGGAASMFALHAKGSDLIFTSRQTLNRRTALPAGTGEFQFWTDGNSGQTAKIGVTLGYCDGGSCEHRHTIKQLNLRVYGGAKGSVTQNGAFTAPGVTLPNKPVPYHLYVQLTVESGAPFNLLYGAGSAPTNLSTPVLLPFD